jgi:hypothetical protein
MPYPEMKEIDHFSYSEYRSEKEYSHEFLWEDACKESFWDKHMDILKAIEQDTDKSLPVKKSRQRMIMQFCAFVGTWEKKAEMEGFTLYIMTNNKICDPWTINALIEEHMSPLAPCFPYSMNNRNKYIQVVESDSVMYGILLGKCPGKGYDQKDGRKGVGEKLAKEFDIARTEPGKNEKHRSVCDAYEIACDFQICLAIGRGDIKPKHTTQ